MAGGVQDWVTTGGTGCPDAVDAVSDVADSIQVIELCLVFLPSEAVAEIFSVTDSFFSSPDAKMFLR